MKKVLLKLNGGKVVLVISKELKQQLFDEVGIVTMSSTGEDYVVGPLYLELEQEPQTKAEKVANVKDWIDEYRETFPKGMNSNGYPYRGDKEACLAKMQKFVREYDYSKDQILKATQVMVNRFKLKDYEYMAQAHYFISKNGVSQLKQFIDMVKDGIIEHVDNERVGGI